MGLVKGGFQRLFQTFLYALLFLCSAIILGIYSYFLSVLADRNLIIAGYKKAVEGISGAAVVYLIFAVVLTCCLGGIAGLAFLAMVLDVLFAAAMIAIAVMTRQGASSCKGNVKTPLGDGPSNASSGGFGKGGFGSGGNENTTYSVHLGLACRLNTVVFAVSIIAAFLFLCTAAFQIALVRHHRKEKRFGPSPANNYTSGYGKKRFGFGRKKAATTPRQTEMGAAGAGGVGRPSHETGLTGSTVGGPTTSYDKVDGQPAHAGHANHAPHGTHGGYYTQPTGTGVNPYGYQNQTNTATNY